MKKTDTGICFACGQKVNVQIIARQLRNQGMNSIADALLLIDKKTRISPITRSKKTMK